MLQFDRTGFCAQYLGLRSRKAKASSQREPQSVVAATYQSDGLMKIVTTIWAKLRAKQVQFEEDEDTKPRRSFEDNIKIYLTEDDLKWIRLSEDK